MIKDVEKYLKESQNQRKRFLQGLNYQKSAQILEELLASELLLDMHFTDRGCPLSLWKQVGLKRGNIDDA